HQDQVEKTLDQFLGAIPLAPDVGKEWFKTLVQKTEYSVGDAKDEGGSKAVVTVKVTKPDLQVWERTVNTQVTSKDTPDAVAQKTLTNNDFPKITYDDNMVMVKEGDAWKLFYNYPQKDEAQKARKQGIE